MILNFFKKHWLILSILLLTLILRVWGVQYGLPGLFVGDEKSLVGGALKMIFEQNIFPVLEPDTFRLLYYPTLIPWVYLIFFVPYVVFIYLTGDFSSIAELRDFFIMDPSIFFLMARIINAFFATGAVFLVYLTTKKIFSQRAGLIAALLYGVSFLPVHQGHFSKHWNFGTFFGLLVLYFAFSILKNPKSRNYLWASLAVGLAFFSDYVFALYGVIVVLVHFFLLSQSFKQKLLSKKLWLFILISLVISGLAILIYPQEFHRMAFGEDSTTTRFKSFDDFVSTSFSVLKTLYYLATFIFFLSLLGYLFLFFQNKRFFFLLIFIPLLCPILYYFIFHFEPRYVLLFLPILAIAAGYGFDQTVKFLKIRQKWLVTAVALLIIFLPLKNALVFDRHISQNDTRNIAKAWLEENISPDSKIIVNSWEFNLTKNQECLDTQQKVNNMSLRSRDYVMMANAFDNAYCVWPLDLVRKMPPDVEDYQYYLYDYYNARYAFLGESLTERLELFKRFEGSPFDPTEQDITMFVHQKLKDRRLGPTVEIYKLK